MDETPIYALWDVTEHELSRQIARIDEQISSLGRERERLAEEFLALGEGRAARKATEETP